MKTISALRLAVASVLALGVVNANAANPASATMTVTAQIVDSCVVAVANMDFGQYDPVDANKAADNVSGQANITSSCTLGSVPKVKLLGAATTNASRPLTGTTGAALAASATLTYGLYSDIGRSTAWNYATGETIAATGVAVTTTIYGKIPMNQNSPTGNYSQDVVVEISF